METIISLNTLCNNCGFFDNKSVLNNGYGCKHKDCLDGEFLDNNGNYVNNVDVIIAKSLTKRNIKCNIRLAKKFIKKARKMSWENKISHLAKKGFKYYGKCFSFSCPISYEVSFDSLKDYENGDEYLDIKNEDEMPSGFGDELMALDIKEAEKMGVN